MKQPNGPSMPRRRLLKGIVALGASLSLPVQKGLSQGGPELTLEDQLMRNELKAAWDHALRLRDEADAAVRRAQGIDAGLRDRISTASMVLGTLMRRLFNRYGDRSKIPPAFDEFQMPDEMWQMYHENKDRSSSEIADVIEKSLKDDDIPESARPYAGAMRRGILCGFDSRFCPEGT